MSDTPKAPRIIRWQDTPRSRVPPPVDRAPRRDCVGLCGGQQALRSICGGGLLWVCQNLGCRRKDVEVPGDCAARVEALRASYRVEGPSQEVSG